MIHTEFVLHSAAQAAAVSAATQESYYPSNSSVGGVSFTPLTNVSSAEQIANDTFQQQQSILNLDNLLDGESASISFPKPNEVTYSVTVAYTPRGLLAAMDILGAIFERGHISTVPQPLVWHINATATGTTQST